MMPKFNIGQKVKVTKGENAGKTGRITEYHKFQNSKTKAEHLVYDLLIAGSTAIGVTEDALTPA